MMPAGRYPVGGAQMSIPNRRQDEPEGFGPDSLKGSHRSNPASVFDDGVTGVMETATSRATTVSHRFGDVRYPLTGRDPAQAAGEDADEPDAEGPPRSHERDG